MTQSLLFSKKIAQSYTPKITQKKSVKPLHKIKNPNIFAPQKQGGLAEWSMAAVLKTVVRQRTGGSNPSASAKKFSEGQLC